tara:strand:+ start:359 stop:1180 length:822 start_codon:yes stop_codon:yes gene_type:complete
MYHYLLPLIIALPKGYDVNVLIPLWQITDRLMSDEKQNVRINCNLINDGKVLIKKEKIISLSKKENRKKTEGFKFIEVEDLEHPSYLEVEITSENKNLIFNNNYGLSFYSIFSSKSKKTFFSDNAFKTGAPNVIYQISKIKRFVDTYSAINVDKNKSLGETMLFINPYKKKVACKITDEFNNFIELIVPPESCRQQKMDYFNKVRDVDNWKGHVQIYATNRLITFNIKHNLNDDKLISDIEHLDPYRLENTTVSLSELARIKLGNFIKMISKS